MVEVSVGDGEEVVREKCGLWEILGKLEAEGRKNVVESPVHKAR